MDGLALSWHDLLLLLVRKPRAARMTQSTEVWWGPRVQQAGEGGWPGHNFMPGRTPHGCCCVDLTDPDLAFHCQCDVSKPFLLSLSLLTCKIGTVIPTS